MNPSRAIPLCLALCAGLTLCDRPAAAQSSAVKVYKTVDTAFELPPDVGGPVTYSPR